MNSQSQQAMNLLRELEQQEDQDLFLVGYLIPQVDLAAHDATEEAAFVGAFRSRVGQSVVEDKLSDQDCREIERLLNRVEARLREPETLLP